MDKSVSLWDVKQDFTRDSRGLSREMRQVKYGELFTYFDPDKFRANERPPDHVESALREVMGSERMKDLKLRPHPILSGYWCLLERHKDPRLSDENLWAVISIFHTGGEPDYLPSDLEVMGFEHLRGFIGMPRQPTRRDFEIIESTDKKKYGYKEVERRLAEPEEAVEREKDRIFGDFTHDFHMYNFWLAMRDAQAHVSRPWSVPTVELKSNPERYVNLPQGMSADGTVKYWLRVRHGSRAHIAHVEQRLEARRQRQIQKGLHKGDQRLEALMRHRAPAMFAEDEAYLAMPSKEQKRPIPQGVTQ